MDRRPTRAIVSLVATVLATAGACTGDDETAGTSTASSRPPIDTITAFTGPPPDRLEELDVALLGANEVGVPENWAIRDLDPLLILIDPILKAEADPFQGLVDCPAGAMRGSGSWLQRTFHAPEQPLDNGLLGVDLIIEAEDDASAEAGRSALAACTPVGPDTSVDVLDVEITVPGDGGSSGAASGVQGTEVIVAAGPSADVPYPSVAVAVTAWRNGRSVTVVAAGLDLGVPLAAVAEELVGRLLARVG